MFWQMWLLVPLQHTPSPSWPRPASSPIHPSRCHSSPSAADLCWVILLVSPLGTLTAAGLREFSPPPPHDSKDLCPFLASGSLLKASWADVLHEPDCGQWIAPSGATEGVFLLLRGEDGNIYFSPFWWHMKHFIKMGIKLTFSYRCDFKPEEKKEHCSSQTLKTSASFCIVDARLQPYCCSWFCLKSLIYWQWNFPFKKALLTVLLLNTCSDCSE